MAGWTLKKIEAIAPDQASLTAARKLVKPAAWSGLCSGGEGLAWGECQGSGASPYRVVIAEIDAGYKCTCPSHKFPCKHCLALMWLRAEGKVTFEAATPPEWIQEWLRRRRTGSAADESKEDGRVRTEGRKSIALARAASEVDLKDEARAAATRERNRKEREESILAGLDDLDQWLLDQIDSGLAGFAAHAGKSCRVIAQRLVDAKASGLAGRLENLPAKLYALAEGARPMAAIEELGQVHLLAGAYRRQDLLTPELRADVRREIGWTQTRESLLADDNALRVTGTWRVAGTLSEVQPDRLRRLETWLWREDAAAGPRAAVLIDFVPLGAAVARSPYMLGERIEATMVFYPSPVPMRALVARMIAAPRACESEIALPEAGLPAALLDYERALCAKPWLGTWLMCFRNARVRRSGEQLFVCSREDEVVGLPLAAAEATLAMPLLALDRVDGIGLWDGSSFKLCMAQTELGRWGAE
jgi:SWIM zinc finger